MKRVLRNTQDAFVSQMMHFGNLTIKMESALRAGLVRPSSHDGVRFDSRRHDTEFNLQRPFILHSHTWV